MIRLFANILSQIPNYIGPLFASADGLSDIRCDLVGHCTSAVLAPTRGRHNSETCAEHYTAAAILQYLRASFARTAPSGRNPVKYQTFLQYWQPAITHQLDNRPLGGVRTAKRTLNKYCRINLLTFRGSSDSTGCRWRNLTLFAARQRHGNERKNPCCCSL